MFRLELKRLVMMLKTKNATLKQMVTAIKLWVCALIANWATSEAMKKIVLIIRSAIVTDDKAPKAFILLSFLKIYGFSESFVECKCLTRSSGF